MSPSDLSYKHYFDYMYQDIFRTVIVNFGATYKIQLLLDKTIGTVYFFFRDTNLVLLSILYSPELVTVWMRSSPLWRTLLWTHWGGDLKGCGRDKWLWLVDICLSSPPLPHSGRPPPFCTCHQEIIFSGKITIRSTFYMHVKNFIFAYIYYMYKIYDY